jgi:hypothetical protein
VRRSAAARGLVVLAALLAARGAGAQGSLDEVIACVRKNAPKTALVQTVDLVTVDRAGQERTQSAKLAAKRAPDGRARLLLRVEDPPDLRGTAFLMIQKEKGSDMFVYLPELKKVRRVSARNLQGKLLGTDFSYEDVERLFGQAEQAAERLPDDTRDGRAVYVVQTQPDAASGSAYTRVVSFVDRETCVPLEITFYEKDAARKVLSVDPARITEEGEVHVPRLVRIRDLAKETESRLVTHDVQVDPQLPDAMFTSGALELKR